MAENEDKNHLKDGDIVHNSKISGPAMVVKELVREKDSTNKAKEHFKGVKCYWFTTENVYQEAIFHAKDLKKYDQL